MFGRGPNASRTLYIYALVSVRSESLYKRPDTCIYNVGQICGDIQHLTVDSAQTKLLTPWKRILRCIHSQFVEEVRTFILPLQRPRIRDVRARTNVQSRELCCRRIREVQIVLTLVNTSSKIRDLLLAHVSPKKAYRFLK